MLDCVDQLSTPAAAAAAMCSGLDVTDTTHERSGSTTVYLFLSHYCNYTKKLFTVHQMLYKPYLKNGKNE